MSVAPLSDADIEALVQRLPTSPRLLAELAPQLLQPEIPVESVTSRLKRDAGLTARLLAAANSAAYARSEPATSLEEAVTCLGFSEVYRIVGAVAAAQLSDEPLRSYGLDTTRFRQNALFVALVMEELAEPVGIEPRDAYTTGLLRSIGKVALDRQKRHAPPTPLPDDQPVRDWERATWGCTGAEISARILAFWRFPPDAVLAVRHHQLPDHDAAPLAHLLNLAAGAADLRGYGLRGEETYWHFAPESFAQAQVDEGKLVWAGERAFQTLQRITTALG